MKKFLVSLVMLVVTTLGAHAQFEKDVWYVNASLTGLDLSHSKYEGTNFGFTLGGGAFVADNFAVLLNFKDSMWNMEQMRLVLARRDAIIYPAVEYTVDLEWLTNIFLVGIIRKILFA